ncbi:MAG: FAD-dependent oxidoreductase [Pseudomonadales bacterium]|nr:FAD-dependent oxidoreductase [Pseudomonadales bacterium]MCP5183764.1 FAD-dependent oxidoreductase [Pseudomonadales bacterium]
MYENLFQPIQVGGVSIPNRIVRSAHGTLLTGEAAIAYHEARARGGVGMITLEATSVHRKAPSSVPLYSDDVLPYYRAISQRIHAHGTVLFQQIYHPGASYGARAEEAWSASAVPNYMQGVVPFAMTQAQIDEVVDAFAKAARRCRDGGLDGVDVHASSGYLLHEFLSPALNHRTDRYGGSLENRMRFLDEVLAAIRAEVNDADFVVGVRLPNEDQVPGGLGAEEVAEIAARLNDRVDYVSLHMGSYWRFHTLIAPTDDPLGVEMAANAKITPRVTKPTIVVGRINTLDHASSIVASGQADMVSMVRALLADPELVNKARRGEENRIRPCIGTNIGCVGQIMSGHPLSCVVNPAAARETILTFEAEDTVTTPKTILIVGGGPAGLEAARTAARRGHRVLLYEAGQRLGGQVAVAAAAPHRADVGAIVSFLIEEIESLPVEVHLNSPVDADVVAAIDPDEVIIATGTTPRYDGFQVSTPGAPVPGFDLPHVVNAWQLFGHGEPVKIRGPAVVYDDTGSYEAISACDALLKAGVHVTMVSRFEGIGASVPFPPVTVEASRERLMSSDFDFIGGHYLRAITSDAVEIGVLYTPRVRRLPAATVVVVSFNEPNRELVTTLNPGNRYGVHLAGDVQGRNGIMNAIHSGAALGRRL